MSVVRKLMKAIKEKGVGEAARLCAKNIRYEMQWYLDRSFDRKYGIDTTGRIEIEKLNVNSDNAKYGVYYEPTPTKIFRYIIKRIHIKHQDYVFIDYGSGKGRTLLLASDLPFKKIIGIEFSEYLHNIAKNNISVYRNKQQRCHNIQSLCVDAVSYSLPDEPCVIFFYNPFEPIVMEKVLSNIKSSIEQNPRNIILIYYNPLSDHLFRDLDIFKHKQKLRLPYDYTREYQRSLMIYSNFTNNASGE